MLVYYQDTQYTTIINHTHSLIKEVTPPGIVAKQFLAHVGILGNEIADSLAKMGRDMKWTFILRILSKH